MKISFVELFMLVASLSLSFILSEEFSDRGGRSSELPKTPPKQFHTTSSYKKEIDKFMEIIFPETMTSKSYMPSMIESRQFQFRPRPRPLGFSLTSAFLISTIPLVIGNFQITFQKSILI